MMKLKGVTKIENFYADACLNAMRKIKERNDMVQNQEDGTISEQNYIITFSYLLGTILKDENMLFGGEIKKIIHTAENEAVNKLIEKLNRAADKMGDSVVKPDFVIHKSLEKNLSDTDGQMVAIEAKTSESLSQDGFSWDMIKLCRYIKELKYDSAIYIIINKCKSKVEDFLDGYERSELPVIEDNVIDHLYFFIQNDISSEPEVYSIVKH